MSAYAIIDRPSPHQNERKPGSGPIRGHHHVSGAHLDVPPTPRPTHGAGLSGVACSLRSSQRRPQLPAPDKE